MAAWVCSPRDAKEEGGLEICDLAISGLSKPCLKTNKQQQQKGSCCHMRPTSDLHVKVQELTCTFIYTYQLHTYTTYMHLFISVCPYTHVHTHTNVYIYMQTFTPTNMYTEREKYHFCRPGLHPKKCSSILRLPDLFKLQSGRRRD